jgi:hypothetical protein
MDCFHFFFVPCSLYKQARAVVGEYEAGIPDVATDHDRYLEDAFQS